MNDIEEVGSDPAGWFDLPLDADIEHLTECAQEWREAREDVLGCSKVEAGQYDRLAMAEHALAKAAAHIP
jgi:hypothetical protein